MVDENYEVIWDEPALDQLYDIYIFIRSDSYQNAQEVRKVILALAAGLKTNPRRYNSDKLRLDNNPDFRAFEIHKIRVSFYINDKDGTVNIIRVRNTRQKPFKH